MQTALQTHPELKFINIQELKFINICIQVLFSEETQAKSHHQNERREDFFFLHETLNDIFKSIVTEQE